MSGIDPLTWTMAWGSGYNTANNDNRGGYTVQDVVREMRWTYDECFKNFRTRIFLYYGEEDGQKVWDTIFPDGLPNFNITVTRSDKKPKRKSKVQEKLIDVLDWFDEHEPQLRDKPLKSDKVWTLPEDK